jgi:hypothetical protein
MIRIFFFLYDKIVFPVMFTIAFGLYHAFYPVMWFKLPRKDFKMEYYKPFGEISMIALILTVLAVAFGMYKLIKLI